MRAVKGAIKRFLLANHHDKTTVLLASLDKEERAKKNDAYLKGYSALRAAAEVLFPGRFTQKFGSKI